MFSSGKYLEKLKKNNNNIYIIQKEKPNYNSKCNLLFMYKPFVNTILQLAPQSKFLYKNWENINFNTNDILIVIGCHFGVKEFINFKKKNLYVIFYWTEPGIVNKNIAQYCDEIFLYSKSLFISQPKFFHQQKIRFVPILKQETKSFVNYLNKKDNIKLCFLGNINCRSKDVRNNFLNKSYFEQKYNLFNENTYNMYMIKNTNIFLNINKRGSSILPFCRICKLLSHKCLIISEHCNKEDEELLEDMVYFCDSLIDIEKTFYNLLSKSPNELYNLSYKNYIKFSNKFSVKNDNLFLIK